jgi:acyl-CoA synthetase (AMP-forming)/AMP-acid ligase II
VFDKALEAARQVGIDESNVISFDDAEHGTSTEAITVQGMINIGSEVPFEGHLFTPHELENNSAYLCYSSGTTGNPKGVQTTHKNMVANIHQLLAMEPMGQDDVVIAMLPFYHIYAMMILLHYSLWRGATVVVQSKFDFVDFLTWISQYRVSHAFVVPPVVLAMAKHPIVDNFDLSSLRTLLSGAAPLGKDVTESLTNRIGVPVRQAYGMTETTPLVTYTLLDDIQPGSSGILAPGMEARIVNELNEDVGYNEPGELILRGPNVMKGYLNNVTATANTIKDGWLYTGDIAVVNDDGHYFIVDRIKELIKYKGLQVAPAELEALLLKHPKIADAAVVGIPSEEAGEFPKAYVVLKPNTISSPQEITDHVKIHASPHKWLRGGVEFIDAIPKSASGKILRRLLRK